MTHEATTPPSLSRILSRNTINLPSTGKVSTDEGGAQDRRSHNRPREAVVLFFVFLLQLPFFTTVALLRFIDGDEGHYLLASRLVLMHKTPYLDFFYNQAPLLPYAYALWMKCGPISWNSARVFSMLLTSLIGVLLYEHVFHQTRNWLAGFSAVVLFASSTLVFAWFPVVKTYSLSCLFLFASYAIISRVSAASPRWIIAASGLLLGLAVDTRSYLLLITPVFLWWIFHNSDASTRRKTILWFLGGFTIAVAPCLLLFIPSPNIFIFDNLRYHAIRSSDGLIGWWQEKLVIVLQLFLGTLEGNGLQWSILFFVSFGLIFSTPKRRPPRLAFQIAVIVAVVSLLPTPAFVQYFCLCVPFLIVSAVCAVNELVLGLGSKTERLVAMSACVAVLGIYVAVSAKDLRDYLITGDRVPCVHLASDRADWRLQRVTEVSSAIDQIASPGEMVASFWPGDIFQSKAAPFPGFENPFALPISEKLTAQQRTRYHIVSPAEIEASFAAHTPRIVVLRNHIFSPTVTADELPEMQRTGDAFRRVLLARGYVRLRTIGDISIYVYNPSPQ